MISDESKIKLLGFNVLTLRILCLWPNPKSDNSKLHIIKDYIYMISVLPIAIPITSDLILQILGDYDDLTGITENFCALADIYGMWYFCICFLDKKIELRNLVIKLEQFQKYGNRDFTIETEKRAALLTKTFLIYAIVGNLCYAYVPYYQMDNCKLRKLTIIARNGSTNGMHCGIITRVRYPVDVDQAPYFHIVNGWLLYVCLLVTIEILMITMFLCSILMHTVEEIKNFKKFLLNVCDASDENEMHKRLNICIQYHIDIIEFAKSIKNAFSTMMLVHMTLTSAVISGLLFTVIMVYTPSESLRFGLHLCGWLFMLLITCYFGQQLLDESTSVAFSIYESPWYQMPVSIQKDLLFMLMRSQKALTLSASSLGVMSLQTFLKVLSTSYSYFTLLLNVRE